MSDLISREEAIKALGDIHPLDYNAQAYKAKITAIPSAVPEREKGTLEKIKAEIERQEKWLLQAGYNTYNVSIAFDTIKHSLAESEE